MLGEHRIGSIAVAMSAFALGYAAAGATIYVDNSAIRGANDGTSWENAFVQLQDGLIAAQPGDEVRVAQGLYQPAAANGPRDATFHLPRGALVWGGFAGVGAADPDFNDPVIHQTVLSGDLNGNDSSDFANRSDNSLHVMTADGVDHTAQVRGVRVVGGSAFTSDPFDPEIFGGGLRCLNGGAPAVHECAFESNQAGVAGGAISADVPGIHVEGCEFVGNRTIYDPSNYGGAIAAHGTFIDCTFRDNYAGATHTLGFGGAMSGGGTLIGCHFENSRGGNGGALYISTQSLVRDCVFVNNFSDSEGGGAIAS